jgi:hypothetical protein
MASTIRMIRHDDGKTGDIHPNEVEHMKAHGWTVAEAAADPDAEKPSEGDDERPALRAEYERVIGKKPYMGWTAEELRQKIADQSAAG